MRIVKIDYKKKQVWGVLQKDHIRLLKSPPFKKIEYSRIKIKHKGAKLLAPATPSKIILVGLNYKDHAKELHMEIPKQPIIFLKPPTALLEHEQKIIYPKTVKRLDYEAELALVIRKQGKNIPKSKAKNYILGYTCCNDITARDLQKKDGQWTRAKSFDTFCPFGPHLETDINPDNLNIRTHVNGQLKQNSSTDNFIFSVDYLVSFVSGIMTLLPGDIISTGTPPGVGPLNPGDKIRIEIEGIGSLRNQVAR